ncbi:MAG: hypothetical protein QM597_06770 [Aeromicrobium sp.]|uniref:hypothetical protein n=1 Tax=Aeromicrobium sp. TaxID=1871063 RepID=UPI0039E2E124
MSTIPDLPKRMEIRYDLADGRAGTVVVKSRARVAFDLTRARRGWPVASDAPFLWVTFLTWRSLSDEGAFEGDFDDFQTACITAEMVGEDDAPPADPTGQDEHVI